MVKNLTSRRILGLVLTLALLSSMFSGATMAWAEEDLLVAEDQEMSEALPELEANEPAEATELTEPVHSADNSSSDSNSEELEALDSAYVPVFATNLSTELVTYGVGEEAAKLEVVIDQGSLIGSGYLTYLWESSADGETWTALGGDLKDNTTYQPLTDLEGLSYYRVKATYHYQANTTPVVTVEENTASAYSNVAQIQVKGLKVDFSNLAMLKEVSGNNSSGLPYGADFQGQLQSQGVYLLPASSGDIKIAGTYGGFTYDNTSGEFTISNIQSDLVVTAEAVHPKNGTDSITAQIMVSFNGEDQIIIPQELTVKKGLAKDYGYTVLSKDHNGVTVDAPTYFDCLVALNLAVYGEEFKKTPTDYLALDTDEGGMGLLKNLGRENAYCSIMLVNDSFVDDGFGVGYAVDANRIGDGDFLNFMFYGDLEGWSDSYSYFSQKSYNVKPNENLILNLQVNNWGAVAPVAGAELYALTEEGIYAKLGDKMNYQTDANGEITLSFPQTGTYLISAKGTFVGWSEGAISYPYAKVTVNVTDQEMADAAEKIVLNLDGQSITVPSSGNKVGEIAKYLEAQFKGTIAEGVKATVEEDPAEANKYTVALTKGEELRTVKITLIVTEVDYYQVSYNYQHYTGTTPTDTTLGFNLEASTVPDKVNAGEDLKVVWVGASAIESSWTPAGVVLPTLVVTMGGQVVDPALYTFSDRGTLTMKASNITGNLEIKVCSAYKGDVTLDGKVNLNDVMANLRHHIKTVPITNADQFAAGDVAAPYDVINLNDVMGVLRHHIKTVILN